MALIGLTVVLLAGVVVPLGFFTSNHDEQLFVESADATGLSVANQAEERLADPSDAGKAGSFLTGLYANAGDQISVYDAAGRSVPAIANEVPLGTAERHAAGRGQLQHEWLGRPGRLVIVLPVISSGRIVGIAALARPTRRLRQEQRRLWLGLGLAGLVALAAATAVALALARWVSRPLRRLDAAAARLGEGTLTARATAAGGPAELEALAVTFNQMASRLENLMAGQRDVIADVSHQLRTPLAALRLRLELVRQDMEGSAGTEVDDALSEVHRLSHLLDGLLAVARAENTSRSPETVDVTTVTRGRVEAWTSVAADSNVTLTVAGPQALAVATPGHLEQILDNLLANAIEATPGGGSVAVEVADTGRRIRLQVSDTGPGMSAAQRNNALRRFWSDGPNRGSLPGDRHGSGLGLAIAQRLVTVDNGVLTLDASPVGGLTATIDLPAARPVPQQQTGHDRP